MVSESGPAHAKEFEVSVREQSNDGTWSWSFKLAEQEAACAVETRYDDPHISKEIEIQGFKSFADEQKSYLTRVTASCGGLMDLENHGERPWESSVRSAWGPRCPMLSLGTESRKPLNYACVCSCLR